METVIRLNLVRVLALAGLAVSTALLAVELAPSAPLCGHDAGCNEVLRLVWARPFGVPLPAAGVVFFAAMLALSVTAGPTAARILRILAGAGGVVGVGLVVVQAKVIERLCPFCLCVDAFAVLTAIVVVTRGFGEGLPACAKKVAACWLVGGFLASSAGLAAWQGVTLLAEAPPPPELLDLRQPERVTIVEIADIRCVNCRKMHRVLDRVEAEFGERVHRICFLHAQPASSAAPLALRAIACARRQGGERRMADSLLHTGIATPDLCRKVAGALGLSLPAFDSCLTEQATADEVWRDLDWLERASPAGVPAVWIDSRRMDGLQTPDRVRAAILDAERVRSYATRQ